MGDAMAFREKSAWISLVLTVLVYGGYFYNLSRIPTAAWPGATIGMTVGAVVVLTILQVIFQATIAIASPKDAQTPQDERERWIQSRASAAAFYVLQFGAIAAAASAYFVDRFVMANVIVAALALGQVVQYGGVIAGYRRTA
jgi:hypothetical protein